MTVFVDSSALYAQLDPDDRHHAASVGAFDDLVRRERLLTHSYALLETTALVQARLGLDAAATLLRELVPLLEIVWVDAGIHDAATTALLAAGRRETSLVDWTSFEIMRRAGIERAFAFDRDFSRQGFKLIP